MSYILSKKGFLIFQENGTLIFPEIELSSPKIKKFQVGTFWARKIKKNWLWKKLFYLAFILEDFSKKIIFQGGTCKARITKEKCTLKKLLIFFQKKVLLKFLDDCWTSRKMK